MPFGKTTPPGLGETLARPRLFHSLDRRPTRRVTWVWGPPGAGKTTLVASYLAAQRIHALWYQVDAADADVATFFHYLGEAAPRRRLRLPVLTPDYHQGLSVFARRYFRELYGRMKVPFALVFDNYQEVSRDALLHEVLREAVEEIPPGGRLIVISRNDLPPAFARHQAHQTFRLIDWGDLRFTIAEATGLARRLAPKRWPRESIRALCEAADGWVAGLVVMLAERRGEAPTSPAAAPRSQLLFDYFAGEVFRQIDRETRDVLLQTSFFPRVSARMAEAVSGAANAGRVLADLHRQNYFVDRRPWGATGELVYEYHPLFRAFLQAQAKTTYPAKHLLEIRRTAAGLLAAADQVEAAVPLLQDAEDWEGVAGLIAHDAPTLAAQGRYETIEAWLTRLPDRIFDDQPWQLYWRGVCNLAWGRHAECAADLERALAAFRKQGDVAGTFEAWALIVISYEGASNLLPLDRLIGVYDELVREAGGPPIGDAEMRVAEAMLPAIVLRQPQHPDGARWADRVLELARHHPRGPLFRAIAALNWYLWNVQRGDLAQATLPVDDMRAVMRARDVSPITAVHASMVVIADEMFSGLPSYRRTVAEILEVTRPTGAIVTAKHGALGFGVFAALSDGAVETAEAWLRETEGDLPMVGPGFRGWHHQFVARAAELRGDLRRAAAHQPEMLRLSLAAGWKLDNAISHLVSAYLLHRCGDPAEARGHLERASAIAIDTGSAYIEFMGRLTEAYLGFERGADVDALHALRIGMAVGRRCGFVNSQVWHPKVMAALCARSLEAGIEVEYVRGLIQKRRLALENPPVEIEAWPWAIKIFTLGRFAVLKEGRPLAFARKVQRKPLALLKAVIALGGRNVREDRLLDALWPDAEGDAARLALTSSVHRLRRLLGFDEAIVRQDNEVSLDARHCWVDVWAVERLLGRAETAAARAEKDEHGWADAAQATERAAKLYQGAFLGGDADSPWTASLTDRLRRRLLRQIVLVGQQRERTAQWHQAAICYETGLRVDPCAEDVCRLLMLVYQRLGRPAEVQATYHVCREALASRLGVQPSRETEALLPRVGPG